MGIRDVMRRHKNLTTGLAVVLIVLGVGTIVWQLSRNNRDTRNDVPNAFFTVDDGRTWFVAGADNLAPFDHDGKQAVKAWVYRCGGKQFVAYMERYTPEAHDVLTGGTAAPAPVSASANDNQSPEAAARGHVALSPAAVMNASVNGKEYKRPGDKEWTPSTDPQKVVEIMTVKCPDGNGRATAVMP